DNSYVYFVHSYYCQPANGAVVCGTTDYGVEFCSMLWADNVYATQFHPEKSQAVGLTMFEKFVRLGGKERGSENLNRQKAIPHLPRHRPEGRQGGAVATGARRCRDGIQRRPGVGGETLGRRRCALSARGGSGRGLCGRATQLGCGGSDYPEGANPRPTRRRI